MDTLQQLMRTTHIWAGFALLALFWVPLFVKKGGRAHVVTGRIYTWVMFGILFTAAALCVYRIATGNWSQGFALGFLTLISFNALWYGYAIAIKKKLTPSIALARRIQFLVTGIYGLVLCYLGVKYGQVLFIIFGILGFLPMVFAVINALRKAPKTQFDWLREHYGNMIISGGAAYTAFLAFGSRVFFTIPEDSAWGIVPWVLPTAIAVIAVLLYNKKRGVG